MSARSSGPQKPRKADSEKVRASKSTSPPTASPVPAPPSPLPPELFDAISDAVWLIDVEEGDEFRCVAVNESFVRITGLDREKVEGRSMGEWFPPANLEWVRGIYREAVRTGSSQQYKEVSDLPAGRRVGAIRVIPLLGPSGACERLFCLAHDLTANLTAERQLTAITRVMSLIAAGAALPEVLTAIVHQMEEGDPACLCSVLLLDDAGDHLLTGAAPSLPEFYSQAIHGIAIGPTTGSCGAAAFLGERVVAEEIRTHPFWADHRDLAQRAGLDSCWSEPISSGAGKVLGAFAIYHRSPHAPSAEDLERMAIAGRLAAIAIERDRTAEAQRLSEENYRSIFESSPLGIYKSSRDGRILAANPAFAALLGYESVDEVLRLRMDRDIYFDDEEHDALIATYESAGSVRDLDILWKKLDGTPIEVRLNSRAIKDEAGRVVAFEGFVVDVSIQKRNERALRESEDRFRDLVDHSRDLICTHDLDGRLLSVNPWVCEVMGYSREEMLQKTIADLLDPEFRDRFPDYLAEVRRNGVARGRMVVATAAGERRIWEYHNTLRTEGVPAPLVRGMGRDVTEHQQARMLQKAIFEIAESGHTSGSLHALFGSIHGIIGKLLPARNFFVALYDEAADEMSFPYFVDEFDSAPSPGEAAGLTGSVLHSGEPLLLTTEAAAGDGDTTIIGTPSVDWLGVPLRSKERVIGALVVQSYSGDLRYTERHKELLQTVSSQVGATVARKQAEAALRESEARYQLVVENISDAIYMEDLQGRVTFANDRFLSLIGLERSELEGFRAEDHVTPECVEMLRERRERRRRGEDLPEALELEGIHRDGRRIPLRVRVSTVEKNGVVVGTQSAIRDISESRSAERERERLEEELRQLLKMEAVGNLAGGVAHDFNNMLAVILGNTEIALSEVDSDHPLHDHLQQIRQATERSITLTRQLLAFARKQNIQPREIDLNRAVASLLTMLERLIGENIELVWRPAAALAGGHGPCADRPDRHQSLGQRPRRHRGQRHADHLDAQPGRGRCHAAARRRRRAGRLCSATGER